MSAVLAGILGTLMFGGVCLTVYYTGVLVPSCGTVGGRVCNDRGTCVQGVCVCDAAWSGGDCGDTLCPEFDKTTGTVCGGRGFCSEWLSGVPPACDNTLGGSWVSSSCKQALVGASPFAIPRCACTVPYISANGGFCNANMCPMDTSNKVCSGYGLPFVNYTNNYTVTGLGCQCNQTCAPRERRLTRAASTFSTTPTCSTRPRSPPSLSLSCR
jgi:hypothetical protein